MTQRPRAGSGARPGEDAADGRLVRAGNLSLSLFLWSLVLWFPPVLRLVEARLELFGIPVIFLFLFGVWTVIVVALYFVAERVAGPDDGKP